MKRTSLLLLILFLAFCSFAQPAATSNLVVFSEDGNRFFLILNGIRQNEKPETNVKVQGLTSPYYTARVIFEDKTLSDIEKKMLMVQDDRGQNLEVTYKIKKDKDGKNVMRFFSQMPTSIAPANVPNLPIYNYAPTVRPNYPVSNGVIQTTTSTTVVQGNVPGNNVNVSANLGGVGVGMNVNINDPMLNSTTTTTTTTYSTTTSVSDPGVTHTNTQPVSSGCNGWPMNSSDFNSAKGSISSKSFEDSKLTTAKQVAGSNCLNADQVKQIMGLFSFEESKLEFAKFAYSRTVDKNNYFKVNDAFSFESSIDDLNKYIQGSGSSGGY